MSSSYWAVMPASSGAPDWSLNNVRIEKGHKATDAIIAAFGRGMFTANDRAPGAKYDVGKWLVKDLGPRISVVRSNKRRLELLHSRENWLDPFAYRSQSRSIPITGGSTSIDKKFLRLVAECLQLPRNRFGKIEYFEGNAYSRLKDEAKSRGWLDKLPHGGEDMPDQIAMLIQIAIGDEPVSTRQKK